MMNNNFNYELHHLKGNTYYIDAPTNIGLYKLNEKDICLIDCGTKDDGVIIYELITKYGFNLKYIILTHSHADHSGGSMYLCEKTGCRIIASKVERAFLSDNKLDIGFLYGGYPLDEYDNRLMHTDDQNEILSLSSIPEGLSSINLPGHHYKMIGIKTSDDVYFVADTLGSIDLVGKQRILLIYDVEGYLNSLDYVESLNGNIIVPAHSAVTTNIKDLVTFNRNQIYENINNILSYLNEERTVEDVVAYIFDIYELKISYNKYMLITSTIRSYLSYLSNSGRIKNYFKNNKLVFISKDAFEDKF